MPTIAVATKIRNSLFLTGGLDLFQSFGKSFRRYHRWQRTKAMQTIKIRRILQALQSLAELLTPIRNRHGVFKPLFLLKNWPHNQTALLHTHMLFTHRQRLRINDRLNRSISANGAKTIKCTRHTTLYFRIIFHLPAHFLQPLPQLHDMHMIHLFGLRHQLHRSFKKLAFQFVEMAFNLLTQRF